MKEIREFVVVTARGVRDQKSSFDTTELGRISSIESVGKDARKGWLAIVRHLEQLANSLQQLTLAKRVLKRAVLFRAQHPSAQNALLIGGHLSNRNRDFHLAPRSDTSKTCMRTPPVGHILIHV